MLAVRDRKSKTLFLVLIAFFAVTIKYVLGGIQYVGHGFTVNLQHMGPVEYGAAFSAIVVWWAQREWTEKVAAPQRTGAPSPVAPQTPQA